MNVDRRFCIIWIIYIVLAIISIWMPASLKSFADILGAVIPSIRDLHQVVAQGHEAAYVFLGCSALLIVPLALYVILDGSTNKRISDSLAKAISPIRQTVFLYAIGMPTIVILIFIAASIPLASLIGQSFGGRLAKWIMEGGIGLVIAGSFFVSALTGMLAIVLALVIFPINQLWKMLGGRV